MTSSPIRVPVTDQLLRPRNAVHAGGQSTIPELQAVLGGMEALDRTTNNAWKTEQGGSWPRSPSRRARLSSAGFTVDADDKGTARFRAAIQAKAARNVTRTEQATSRRLCGELFNNGNDAVSNSVTMTMLLARCFFRACSRGAPRSADQVMSFVGRASSGQLPT